MPHNIHGHCHCYACMRERADDRVEPILRTLLLAGLRNHLPTIRISLTQTEIESIKDWFAYLRRQP